MPKILKNPWREAVIEALVVNGIYDSKRHDANAKTAVVDLISCETQQALDPAISPEARQLVSTFSGELLKWKGGDWCDVCDAPQLVLSDGEHHCMSLADLQKAYIEQLKVGYDLNKELRRAAAKLSELQSRLDAP